MDWFDLDLHAVQETLKSLLQGGVGGRKTVAALGVAKWWAMRSEGDRSLLSLQESEVSRVTLGSW